MADQSSSIPLAADILRGVGAISEYTGETERRTYYLLQRKLLPGMKQGAVWLSRKSALDRHYKIDNPPGEHQPA